jgi:hypothetical protein
MLASTSRRVTPAKAGKENELAPVLGIALHRVYAGAVRCHGIAGTGNASV